MILLVIFFWPNPSNFTPKAAFSLSLICKIFLCYPVGMWLPTNLETKLHFVLNINVGTRAIKKVTHHMGILHPKSFCPLRMTDVNKKHLSDHARNPDTRLSRSWYLHSYPRLHAFPSITQWFLPVFFFIMKESHK